MSDFDQIVVGEEWENTDLSLLETLDHVLNRGLVIAGEITIAVADIDLIFIGLNVLVYVLELAIGDRLLDHLALYAQCTDMLTGRHVGCGVADGQWYRLVTAMFLHASLLHLAFNMLALYWLGSIVEQALGSWRFLALYFVSGIAGSAGARCRPDGQAESAGGR